MLSIIEIGERVSAARRTKNISQAQLAESLGISAQAVGKWERGESMPDIITFGRMAELLGVGLDHLVGTHAAAPAPANPGGTDEETERKGWNMSGGNWSDADFSGLRGLAERFGGSNIERCRFVGSDLSGLLLKGNNMKDNDLTRSDLSRCRFANVNLENNDLTDCDLSRSEFTRCRIKGCGVSGADLTNTMFKWHHISGADLTGATLHGTEFRSGQLTDVVFGDMTDCSFENCDFSRVEFRGATVRNTFFKNCKLNRVKFIDCRADRLSIAFMKVCKADLSGVVAIEE